MNRDEQIYGRAMQLQARCSRRFRMGRITAWECAKRSNRITRAHYMAQHAAGATDYPLEVRQGQ